MRILGMGMQELLVILLICLLIFGAAHGHRVIPGLPALMEISYDGRIGQRIRWITSHDRQHRHGLAARRQSADGRAAAQNGVVQMRGEE